MRSKNLERVASVNASATGDVPRSLKNRVSAINAFYAFCAINANNANNANNAFNALQSDAVVVVVGRKSGFGFRVRNGLWQMADGQGTVL